MDNPTFVDDEDIPLINEDYNNFRLPDTSRIDKTSFIRQPDTTEVTSTLRLSQKLKRDKIVSLCRYPGVTGDPDLVDLD